MVLVPVASGLPLLTVPTGVDLVVQDLPVGQVSLSLLSGQDGLNVVVVQTQSLQKGDDHRICVFEMFPSFTVP